MMAKDMTGRVRCCVPGCGRTFKEELVGEEVICGKHFRLADRRLRQLIAHLRRKARRVGWTEDLWERDQRLWQKVRDQAIERAMGL
jgi:uncharacterized protein YecT (DUF1311 family)